MITNIPLSVMMVLDTLQEAGHEAYIVGGCVRDHLLGRTPKDYDVTTSARPDEVQHLFPRMIPTGIRYGTVTVVMNDMPIEVTTFRADGEYSDGRRPDSVTFGQSVEDDLARRDFTMNAIAWSPATGLVDPFNGTEDIEQKHIRAVGHPSDRFREDALRMLRAVRFASTLGFEIGSSTLHAIRPLSHLLKNVALERVREELNRILTSEDPAGGISLLHITGLLDQFLPELGRCVGFEQHNPHHGYAVFDHILRVVEETPAALPIRLAALLHDAAKPVTFTMGDDRVGHFYQHEVVGAQIALGVLERLKYDRATIDKVTLLVREHMFPAEMGTKGIRRLVARIGMEHVPDLMALRVADVRGSGVPDDLSHVDRVFAVTAEMKEQGITNPAADLAITGNDVMTALDIRPGPAVGEALRRLTELVLDDPSMNTRERLIEALADYENQ